MTEAEVRARQETRTRENEPMAETALAWMRENGFTYEAMRTDDLPVLRGLIHAFCQARTSRHSDAYTLESVA
jgi:hypothetical protein